MVLCSHGKDWDRCETCWRWDKLALATVIGFFLMGALFYVK